MVERLGASSQVLYDCARPQPEKPKCDIESHIITVQLGIYLGDMPSILNA